eukprot:TRINITY_DN2012_c0_g1_i2.p1 TRINITY_DN2012_c0_g1~~TRINITY_DN2012_c0_g1_i2.p1  ORF type:complete len:492 (+),score=77.26 TRINITY_DN2012_c0_g1_i2:66-1478(+)
MEVTVTCTSTGEQCVVDVAVDERVGTLASKALAKLKLGACLEGVGGLLRAKGGESLGGSGILISATTLKAGDDLELDLPSEMVLKALLGDRTVADAVAVLCPKSELSPEDMQLLSLIVATGHGSEAYESSREQYDTAPVTRLALCRLGVHPLFHLPYPWEEGSGVSWSPSGPGAEEEARCIAEAATASPSMRIALQTYNDYGGNYEYFNMLTYRRHQDGVAALVLQLLHAYHRYDRTPFYDQAKPEILAFAREILSRGGDTAGLDGVLDPDAIDIAVRHGVCVTAIWDRAMEAYVREESSLVEGYRNNIYLAMEILLNASRKLLELGLDPNRVIDEHNNTALHLAAVMGSAQLCKLFLEAGAEKKKNHSKKLPMDYIKEESVPGLPNTTGMRAPVDFGGTVIGISQAKSRMEAANESILLVQDAEVLRLLGGPCGVSKKEAPPPLPEDDPSIDEYSVRKSFCNTRHTRKH